MISERKFHSQSIDFSCQALSWIGIDKPQTHDHAVQKVLTLDNAALAKLLATLQQLGVMPSRSRPSVSNDNPYSESLFKTLKYGAQYPTQPFASLTDVREEWVTGFMSWYNHEHRHSSIQFVTPEQRHTGEDRAILKQRQPVLQAGAKD